MLQTDLVSNPSRVPTHAPRNLSCSACASYGHRADECYQFRFQMQDDVISSDVRQYEKVYSNDVPPINTDQTAPYAMFESPREDFTFNWNVDERPDRFYGRFMEATKIERVPVNYVSTQRRRKTKKSRQNITQLVLNPMNSENIREKPKKQFAKNFYEESTTSAPNKSDQQVEATKGSVAKSIAFTNVDTDNDVLMKEMDSRNVGHENGDEYLCIPNDEDKLLQEAKEVDELRGPKSFSFCKEMDGLEQSKAAFDLSFIGDEQAVDIDDSPKTSKTRARKLMKEAEIEKLTEMEISLNKLKDQLQKKESINDIVLNISHPLHSVHDSDSNYSFSEYFNESKAKDGSKSRQNSVAESPDFIPLPPHIDGSDLADVADTMSSAQMNPDRAADSAKIFLTKEHARLLLKTDAGNKLLSDASVTHQVKVRMDWENLGNVLIVIGSRAMQNKFHADLIRFLVDMCKKMRIKNETLQNLPRSKVALIRFIREQFALLEQPLGNVNELHKAMIRNENMQSKNGTKNADRFRKHLNIILMGKAGLRDGRRHLTQLESNLKFLLTHNKDMITRQTREEISQHYSYIFSPIVHDKYPDLIAEYEEMKRSKTLPPLNIDKTLMAFKISIDDDNNGDLNRAKQKLLRISSDTDSSPKINSQEAMGGEEEVSTAVDVVLQSEPKTPTRELKNVTKREPKTPKQQTVRSPRPSDALQLPTNSSADDLSNKNAIWSLKCKVRKFCCFLKEFICFCFLSLSFN